MTKSSSLQNVWWLNPLTAVILLHFPVVIAAASLSPAFYEQLWRTPKYFSPYFLAAALGTSVFLSAGFLLGSSSGRKTMSLRVPLYNDSKIALLHILVRGSFALTLLGYLFFAVSAYRQGFGLQMLTRLTHGERGFANQLRHEYFQTTPGLTTCTQFGMACCVLSLLLARQRGWRSVRLPLLSVFALSAVRAIVLSERLALLEVILPAAFLAVRLFSNRIGSKPVRRTFVRFAPVLAPVGLYILFAGSEYFRSWTYYASHASSLWEFAFARLSGYYLTSMNNSAYLLKTWQFPSILPVFTFEWLLKFPGLTLIMPGMQGFSLQVDEYRFALFSSGLNPEFNNPGGMLSPLIDYGMWGGMIFWLLTGLLFGRLYRSFRQGRPLGLLLYPFCLLSLLELPRVLYWTLGRAFPSLALLSIACLMTRYSGTVLRRNDHSRAAPCKAARYRAVPLVASQ